MIIENIHLGFELDTSYVDVAWVRSKVGGVEQMMQSENVKAAINYRFGEIHTWDILIEFKDKFLMSGTGGLNEANIG